jgi:hypothetical protein
MEAITHLCDRAILLSGGTLAVEGEPVVVVHDYFALSGQALVAAPAFAPRHLSAPGHAGALEPSPAVAARLRRGVPGAAHAASGTRHTEIVGFTLSGSDDDAERWTVEGGAVVRFWYLVEARRPCRDLNVGIHFYDRRGILVFAVGTANRGVVFPSLSPGDRIVCALGVRLALGPGAYTVVPQSGGLTAGAPEPGLLHDRLENLPPVVVTRLPGGPAPFYGLVELDSTIAWAQDRGSTLVEAGD